MNKCEYKTSLSWIPGLDNKHPVTGKTALHEAVTMNNLSVARVLINAGANPNFGHVTQGPPLLSAAAFGETELVELLLSAGADIAAADIAGYTALHYACSGGHVATARILLAAGCDPQVCVWSRSTWYLTTQSGDFGGTATLSQ